MTPPTKKPFSLASLDTYTRAQTGVAMPVVHPRERTPIVLAEGELFTVTLCGRSSDAFRQATRLVESTQADRAARGAISTPEEAERDNVEILTACTRGWTPFPLEDGDQAPFEYSIENARRLWSDRRFQWLREQAMRFVRDDANFLAS